MDPAGSRALTILTIHDAMTALFELDTPLSHSENIGCTLTSSFCFGQSKFVVKALL